MISTLLTPSMKRINYSVFLMSVFFRSAAQIRFVMILLSLGLATGLLAQNANWTDFNQRQQLYPVSEYFTGFSMQEVDKQEDIGEVYEKLKESALSNLSKSIQVTVESVTTLSTLELNEEFQQGFRQKLASFSRVDLAGMVSQTTFDKKAKIAYAMAYVKKSDLREYYQKVINKKKEEIAQKIKMAIRYNELNEKDDALKTYYECMPLFIEIEEAQTIVILLEAANPDLQEIKNYELQVREAITQLFKSEQLSLDDVCSFMAFGLKIQTGSFDNIIRLTNFTYEDTRMGSRFSRRFAEHFEKELINTADYNVTSSVLPPTSSVRNPRHIIQGTYWIEGDKIKIIAILRDMKDGKPVATVDGFLPEQWLQENNISWKPENFEFAHQNMLQFRKDEIVDGNMTLEVWTNKGNESPIFEENDTLTFYIRVNYPCYVRIINHFADNTRVLLVDNDYIGTDKVNKVVKIREEFLCSPPFGAEVLQVNAQTETFEPLLIEDKWNYKFILGELDEVLKITRGFKPVKNDDLRAEERIVVTTIDKP